VLTLRAAAELLSAAHSIDALIPIAAAAGCDGVPAPLDLETRRGLGFGVEVIDVRVVAGPGALRALLLELRDDRPLRELLPRIAARLASRAPHVLWLLVATQPRGSHAALAAWTGDRSPPRVAALVADRTRIVDSDAESLRALAAAAGQRDLLTHARWVEVLGRDALTRRFYRTLERVVAQMAASAGGVPTDAHDEIALLFVSRLLFLAFLEAKGWLDGDHGFLARNFDRCMATGGGFHRRVLRPLFFGTLNTPLRRRATAARALGRIPFLNGGLFTVTAVERGARGLAFSDESYGALLHDLFGNCRFTAREESVDWSEAAVDPEMMGKAFESLMAARERRSSGAYYTPHHLVERVTMAGLKQTLARAVGERAATALLAGDALSGTDLEDLETARAHLRQLTVLDPSCGSGAFLVRVLERVADLRRQLGDSRDIAAVRRDVLTASIFGVDTNPTAVWLCELRLWLSVVIESSETDPSRVSPLPNLDHNIRVGDALAGGAFAGEEIARGGRELRALRQRYARATGGRKKMLARGLDRAERGHHLREIDRELAAVGARRRELVSARRGHDLFGVRAALTRDERATARTWRARAAELRKLRRRVAAGGATPFSFGAHFADVAARNGFDLVVGNPPWVRLHRVPATARAAFRREFVVARLAAWEPGAGSAGAGRGFAAQIDLAALFVERSLRLLAPSAALSLLVPAKLWRSLAAGGMRRLLATDATLRRLEDFSEAPSAFDAAVYPSLITATRRSGEREDPCVAVRVHRGEASVVEWKVRAARIPFDESAGSPWITLPPDVRRAFDALRVVGQPLAESAIGRAHLGVKCGCNDAFIVHPSSGDAAVVTVSARDGRSGTVERALLRPLIRGENVAAWRVSPPRDAIVWTHDEHDAVLRTLPQHAARWLGHWRRALLARADARRAVRWWTLFRVEAARVDRPRVVWADLGRVPRAAVLFAGDAAVPLNTCYVARCRDETDACALAALLNGPFAAAWLNALAG